MSNQNVNNIVVVKIDSGFKILRWNNTPDNLSFEDQRTFPSFDVAETLVIGRRGYSIIDATKINDNEILPYCIGYTRGFCAGFGTNFGSLNVEVESI